MAKICRYCTHWETTKARYRRTEEGEIHKRKCEATGNTVRENTEACAKFYPHNYFWCDQNNQRILTLLCAHRQSKKDEDCQGCLQGRDVLSVLRGFRTDVVVRRKRD